MENKYKLPLSDYEPRGCDDWGCGHFGAPRGKRKHKGLDLVVHDGQIIKAPISGVVRVGYPYSNNLNYKLVEIKNATQRLKIMYVSPSVITSQKVVRGQAIGNAQNISAKYGQGMKNHIHVEYYLYGKLVDPAKYLK